MKLNMALVGAGVIGKVHAVALQENPKIEFVAVVDLKKDAAQALANQYGIPAYSSINECLQQVELDAFDICVDEDHHLVAVKDAARAKKHILLEKPIAKTVQEALRIKQLAEQNEVRLMIAHLLHFEPRYALALDAVRQGRIGEVSSIFVKRCNTLATCKRIGGKVSFMYYLAVHDIELMCSYAGSRPVKVYAVFPDKVCRAHGDYDGVFAIITFANGVVGSLEINWSYQESMPLPVWSEAEIIGSLGSVNVELGKQGLTISSAADYSYPDTALSPVFNGLMHGAMTDQIDHFASCLIQGKPFLLDLETPIDAVKIIEACFLSHESGLPVSLEA